MGRGAPVRRCRLVCIGGRTSARAHDGGHGVRAPPRRRCRLHRRCDRLRPTKARPVPQGVRVPRDLSRLHRRGRDPSVRSRGGIRAPARMTPGKGGPERRSMSDTEQQSDGVTLSALLHETRHFDPPPGFAAQANARPGIYEEAAADPLAWWEREAERLQWDKRWDRVLERELPFAKWFVGGKLNAA